MCLTRDAPYNMPSTSVVPMEGGFGSQKFFEKHIPKKRGRKKKVIPYWYEIADNFIDSLFKDCRGMTFSRKITQIIKLLC